MVQVLTKSRAAMVDEVQRCDRLGITLYNFHPGYTFLFYCKSVLHNTHTILLSTYHICKKPITQINCSFLRLFVPIIDPMYLVY